MCLYIPIHHTTCRHYTYTLTYRCPPSRSRTHNSTSRSRCPPPTTIWKHKHPTSLNAKDVSLITLRPQKQNGLCGFCLRKFSRREGFVPRKKCVAQEFVEGKEREGDVRREWLVRGEKDLLDWYSFQQAKLGESSSLVTKGLIPEEKIDVAEFDEYEEEGEEEKEILLPAFEPPHHHHPLSLSHSQSQFQSSPKPPERKPTIYPAIQKFTFEEFLAMQPDEPELLHSSLIHDHDYPSLDNNNNYNKIKRDSVLSNATTSTSTTDTATSLEKERADSVFSIDSDDSDCSDDCPLHSVDSSAHSCNWVGRRPASPSTGLHSRFIPPYECRLIHTRCDYTGGEINEISYFSADSGSESADKCDNDVEEVEEEKISERWARMRLEPTPEVWRRMDLSKDIQKRVEQLVVEKKKRGDQEKRRGEGSGEGKKRGLGRFRKGRSGSKKREKDKETTSLLCAGSGEQSDVEMKREEEMEGSMDSFSTGRVGVERKRSVLGRFKMSRRSTNKNAENEGDIASWLPTVRKERGGADKEVESGMGKRWARKDGERVNLGKSWKEKMEKLGVLKEEVEEEEETRQDR